MELVEDDGEDAEETTRGILTTHARDLKRVQRHASGNLGVEGSLEHDAAMLQQVADRTRKRFVKRIGGLRKVFAAGRITDGGPVSCGPPGGGAPLADDAAQALRELQQQMEQLRPAPALADTAANGGATPRVTETVRKSVLNLEVEESPLSVVSCVSDDEDMSPLVLPPPPPGGPSSSSKAGGGSGGGAFREQLLTSEVSSSSSVADGSEGTAAAESSAALQEALTAQARKLRSLKTTLQRTAGQRSQLLHRPQPAVTALHYWLEHTALCCSTYDALVDVDRAMDIHLALDAESAALAELQNQFREAFAGLPEPSAGGDSDVPWGAESPAEAVPSLLRRRAPPFIRLPGPDEFCCALRTRLPAGRGGAGMALGGVVAASPRTPRGVLPAMPTTRSAKRPPPSEPAFVELVQGFLRRELGLTRQQGEAGEQGRARPAGLGEGGSLVEVLERGFDLAPVQRQTLSAELSQRTIAVSEDGEESPADLERAVEAVDATWVDRLLGPPLGCKRVGYMLKRNKRGLWQARWFVLRSDANSAGELRYYRRHTNTLAEIGQGGGGGGGGGAARTINTAPKTPKMTRNVRQPEPEPEPELELMGGGEGEGVAVVECEQPLGTLDLARAVSCYACGALHGERRRRDVRVQTPLRTWRLRARSAREAVAWATDLEEMRAQAAIRLQRQQQQQQQQRRTPLSRSGSSSSSISRRASTGAESYVDEDDEYEYDDDDDDELDSPVSVCTPGVTPTPTAMSKHEPSEGVGGADDDDHDDDGDTQQLAERVSAARARQAELQERRCRLESELLAERPRRVASLLGRDLRLRTRTGTGTDNTSGDESKAAASPGSVSVSGSGSESGSGCGWQLCRDLREDVSLGRMPGGVLLAEAYCTAATTTTITTSASASSASGTPGPSVVVVAAVDLLALRLDKGEAAAVARRAAFEGEAERLRAIPHHPRLCNFLQLCSGPRECALVFDGGDDAYDGGTQTAAAGSSTDTAMDIGRGMGMACSLQQFIRAHGPRLAPTLSRTLFTDLLTALAFLHERGLHHGQITADSVLIYPRRRGDSGTGAPAQSDGQQPTGTVVASSSSSSSSSSAATLSLGHTDSFSELCLEVGWVNTGDGIMEEAMPMPAAVSMTPLAHALLTPRLRADPQAILSPPVLAAEGDGEAGAEVGGGGAAVSDDDDEVSLRPLPAGGEFSCRLLPAVGSMMHPAADHITAAASGSVADDLWSLGALLHRMLAGSAVLLLEPDPTTADALDGDDDDDDGGGGGGDDSGAKEMVEGGAAASRGARTGSRADAEPELDPSLPEAAADMVRRLVRTDPAKRQSAASSLEHRWIVEASQLPRASSRSNFEEELRALNRDRKEARQARIERAKALKQAPPPGSAGRAGAVQHDQAQQQVQAQEAQIGADVDAALNRFYSSDDDQSTGSSSSSWSDGEDERAPRHVAAAAGGAGAAATEWTEI